MSSSPVMLLYKWPSKWDLPSLSPACIYVEAYLRFAKEGFNTEVCSTPNRSPTGTMPAFENGDDLIDTNADPSGIEGNIAAHKIIEYLKKIKHIKLDAGLTADECTELLAFTALVEAKLVPATSYYSWVEAAAYKEHTREAYAQDLPFPLSHVQPRAWRARVLARLDPAQRAGGLVLRAAEEVIDALAARLQARRFFFDHRPSSLDALMFAHLSFALRAPQTATTLRPLIAAKPSLVRYLSEISGEYFNGAAPPPPVPPPRAAPERGAEEGPSTTQDEDEQSWYQWAFGGGPKKRQLTEREARFKRRSRAFMALMAGAVMVQLLFGGLIQFEDGDSDAESESEEEEEDPRPQLRQPSDYQR